MERSSVLGESDMRDTCVDSVRSSTVLLLLLLGDECHRRHHRHHHSDTNDASCSSSYDDRRNPDIGSWNLVHFQNSDRRCI